MLLPCQGVICQPPKIKYQVALEIDDVPAERAEDEAWWLMLIVTTVQPLDESALYDKLLPWLAGAPLEHVLAEQASSSVVDGSGDAEEGDATSEWRTAQSAQTDSWR